MTDEELDYLKSRLYRASGWKSVPIYRYVPRLFFSRKTVGGCSPLKNSII
jgi:hypothetical protein